MQPAPPPPTPPTLEELRREIALLDGALRDRSQRIRTGIAGLGPSARSAVGSFVTSPLGIAAGFAAGLGLVLARRRRRSRPVPEVGEESPAAPGREGGRRGGFSLGDGLRLLEALAVSPLVAELVARLVTRPPAGESSPPDAPQSDGSSAKK